LEDDKQVFIYKIQECEMKNLKISVLLVSLLLCFSGQVLNGQGFNGDMLNEAPLHYIPGDMTYEEYKDMNRRVSVGLMLSAIPVPGLIHSYAGEAQKARKIRYMALGGLATCVAGMFLIEEGDFPDSDYQLHIINSGQDNERRYEMIPAGMDGNDVNYSLREIRRESDGVGQLLIPIGLGIIAYEIIYDYYFGIKLIEEKRDKVRYKYGKKLTLSAVPDYQQNHFTFGAKLSYTF